MSSTWSASTPRESTPTSQHPGHDADRDQAGPRRQAPDQREQQTARLDQARVERDQARADLERARAQRDQAARVMGTLPRDPQAQRALADARYAAGQAQSAAAHGQQLDDQLGELGRLQRLGQQGRTLKAQLAATRDRQRQAAERQQRREQEAAARKTRLDHQRHAWEAQHPGAQQRHHTTQHAYEQAQQRHQTAEQTYDALLTQGLLDAAVPDHDDRRSPPRPGEALEHELDRPARGIERGREGPSLGF